MDPRGITKLPPCMRPDTPRRAHSTLKTATAVSEPDAGPSAPGAPRVHAKERLTKPLRRKHGYCWASLRPPGKQNQECSRGVRSVDSSERMACLSRIDGAYPVK